ncbi:MAG TPA: sulfite exporter TauE/SafE family protein [Stellaceae bacterium]|nr:sulfite exporter TauE/SafE family protein [Stellaceae bacterium]
MTVDLPFVVSGFGVGFLVGMTGVGGGSLMTPLLILMFGVHPATAVGTDLLFAASTKVAGSAVHGANRNIVWRVVGLLATGSVPATALTLIVLSRVPLNQPGAVSAINSILGIALLLTGCALIFRRWLVQRYAERVRRMKPARRDLLTVLMGAILGVLVSVSSVGAGAIGVTALLLLYPEQPTVRIVGSDIAHAVPLTLAAGFGHWLIGSIDFALLGSLLLGSVPGVIAGSFGVNRVPDAVLRPIFAVTLFLVGGRLLF